MAVAGKQAVYLPAELADALTAWEAVHGKINLSGLVQETIRRKIGALDEGDRQADQVTAALSSVRTLERAVKALEKRVKTLERAK